MKKPDKFLVWFVIAVALLVVTAFAIALLRPKATYQPEDKPEGVAFNYLFALQQKDYERAYGYLSPSIRGYPADLSDFRRDIESYAGNFDSLQSPSTTLEILSAEVTGKTAIVKVKETHFYEGGLFDSGEYSNTFGVTLRQEGDGSWKIEKADSYWAYCWNDWRGCR